MEAKKIGFVGTGVMGASIVKHLLNAGHEVTIYTRTKSKADALVSLGAKWAETPAKASNGQQIIFTMVGYLLMWKKCITESMGFFQLWNQVRLSWI